MLNTYNEKGVFFVFAVGLFLGGAILSESTYAADTIRITSSGAQNISVAPKKDGVGTTISEDAITVNTTCKNGYNFAISTSGNDNNLYLNGDNTKNTSGTYFAPSDGIAVLAEATNTWGYYYDGTSGDIHENPVYFPYAGYWDDGGSSYVGSYGKYWSSVVNDDDYAYCLFFDAYGDLNPQYDVNRSDGNSVRCVAR